MSTTATGHDDLSTTDQYATAIRTALRSRDEVASKTTLRADTDVPDWYIDQLAASDLFYTSLTHNGRYVASKHVVGHRATHDGFWRPEVDDGEAVFHRQETTKATLKHLAFNRPSGLTSSEANELLNRRCNRALRKLADQQEVHVADFHDTTVYTHSWPSRRDAQLTQRETDHPTDVTPDEPDQDGFLYRDELVAVFLSGEFCQERLDCPLQSGINPRRSGSLKAIKPEIKDLFEEHDEGIDSPYDR